MNYKKWKILKTEIEQKQDEYTQVVEWCKYNNYAIVEDGEYYKTQEVVFPEPGIPEQIAKLKNEITDLDRRAIRPLRAIAAGIATEEDRAFLMEIETQAEIVRAKIRALENKLSKTLESGLESGLESE